MIVFRFSLNVAKILAIFLILLLSILGLPYLKSNIYNFSESKPFDGQKIYNPYSTMDSASWVKGNFQIQSYAWKGVTSGRMNSNERIDSLYKYLDYDVIATSDYMKINRFGEDLPDYIPVYEHGYGIFKNHQVCIGAERVNWLDFFYYQSLHHKQQIINELRDENDLIFIAHPKLRKGYAPEDFKYLANYDGIEVLNNYRTSLKHWDSALSTGHFGTILSDDDAHDISNPDEVGHYCTFINVQNVNRKSIVSALKTGNAFGADIYREHGDSYQVKKEKLKGVAQLKSVLFINDSIQIRVDQEASEIRFIGQNGALKFSEKNTFSASYKFNNDDTYIRVEIFFPNKNKFYLNPFVRYDDVLNQHSIPEISWVKTWTFRSLVFLVLLMMAYLIYRITKSIHFRVRS
jgi:hypothetical protein